MKKAIIGKCSATVRDRKSLPLCDIIGREIRVTCTGTPENCRISSDIVR